VASLGLLNNFIMYLGKRKQANTPVKLAVEIPTLALQACIDKREVKGSIRMKLRMREVDKSGAA
jgi:hypothetical protein